MLFSKFLLLFLLIPFATANLQINEIMFAPLDGNEWVEIYNPTNQTINLTGWFLSDNKNTDTLECCQFENQCTLVINPLSYGIITDQDTTLYDNITTNSLKICVDDNSLGNGLSNSGDIIKIYNNFSKQLVEFSDNLSNKNGLSLEFDDGIWRESYILGGTPGVMNSQFVEKIIVINITNESNKETFELSNTEIKNMEKISSSFEIASFSSEIMFGDIVQVKVLVKSGSDSHKFSVWGYVYRGKKCFSCISFREENMQTISLTENEEKTIMFDLSLHDDIEPGEYNLKIKILKDDQSTPKELKEKIVIKPKPKLKINEDIGSSNVIEIIEESIGYNLTNSSKTDLLEVSNTGTENKVKVEKEKISNNKLTGKVVYQSKSKKIKGLIPYFLSIAFGLLVIVFIFNR